jgi:hypothetical protein
MAQMQLSRRYLTGSFLTGMLSTVAAAPASGVMSVHGGGSVGSGERNKFDTSIVVFPAHCSDY